MAEERKVEIEAENGGGKVESKWVFICVNVDVEAAACQHVLSCVQMPVSHCLPFRISCFDTKKQDGINNKISSLSFSKALSNHFPCTYIFIIFQNLKIIIIFFNYIFIDKIINKKKVG